MSIDLRPIFETVTGNSIIAIDSTTEPTLKGGKANPFKGRVKKIMRGANVMVFTNKKSNGYENMVRRRLEKEGKIPETFVLGDRPWGTRLADLPIVEHNGAQYLEVIFLRAGQVHYEVDGVPTSPETITGLDLDPPVTNPEAQGGLDNMVIIRTFKAESLTRIVIDGNVIAA